MQTHYNAKVHIKEQDDNSLIENSEHKAVDPPGQEVKAAVDGRQTISPGRKSR